MTGWHTRALLKLTQDPQSKRNSDAAALTTRIASGIYNRDSVFAELIWLTNGPATNRNSWGISEIESAWRLITPLEATAFIKFVAAHTNVSEEQRIVFFRMPTSKIATTVMQAANEAAKEGLKAVSSNIQSTFPLHRLGRGLVSVCSNEPLVSAKRDK